MSVSVNDLLNLPSLAHAKVVAGRRGLDRIVVTVSVLETIDYSLIDDHTYNNDEFNGSEIVITGFLNAVDDFEVQYESVKRLAMSGEAGLIIYYVGSFVKHIDKRIIKLADDLDFPIICMPENNVNLRYGEAISDIMSLIVRDQISGESLVVNLLESISRLPRHQQNVGTMTKLLCSRIKCCVVLTTDKQRVLYEAAWPSDLEGIHKQISKMKPSELSSNPVALKTPMDGLLYLEPIQASGSGYQLYIFSAGGSISDVILQQATECMRIALKLWGKDSAGSPIYEIISAILMDEPIKMRSLSAMLNIDIASANTMWIIRGKELHANDVEHIVSAAKKYCKTAFADIYQSELILFTDNINDRLDVEALRSDMEAAIHEDAIISFFSNLRDTTDVRKSYLAYQEYINDMVKIFPTKKMYQVGDLEFAGTCRSIIEKGDETVNEYLETLKVLDAGKRKDNLADTICTFLLDCHGNVQETSELLFVHKNTIKYRIKTVGDYLGFRPGDMPESTKLYISCGIQRLIR